MLPISRIIAPTDFSDASKIGLQAAVELASHFSAELHLVHIVTPIPEFYGAHAPTGYHIPSVLKELQEGARGSMQELVDQEVPDGKFYLDAFLKRARNPMLQAFGERPELLRDLAADIYGATPIEYGDVSVAFRALPLVPVALILWRGDDEFPPEGNVLFDESIPDILPSEDIAWLAGTIVYPLMGRAGKE